MDSWEDVNEELEEETVRDSHAVTMAEILIINLILSKIRDGVLAMARSLKIGGYSSSMSRREAERLTAAVAIVFREAMRTAQATMLEQLVATALTQGSRTGSMLTRAVPGAVAPVLTEAAALRVVRASFQGSTLSARQALLTRKGIDSLADAIATSVSLGDGYNRAAERMSAALQSAIGFRVPILVRTELHRVVNAMRLEVYKANADVLSGVVWVATLDDKTCDACWGMDRKVFSLDDAPSPPKHPSCRCALAPLTKTWEELGIPVDQNKYPGVGIMDRLYPRESSPTYADWLNRQAKDVQMEALGLHWYNAYIKGNYAPKAAGNRKRSKIISLVL